VAAVRKDVLRPVAEARIVLADGETEVASWPLAPERPGLALVDELARLQLAAARLGWAISVRDAHQDLRELLELVGLADLLAR
jgi:hypothetical protein